jgi:hypothetical protein
MEAAMPDNDLVYSQPTFTPSDSGYATVSANGTPYATEYQEGDTTPDGPINVWLKNNLLHERGLIVETLVDLFAERDDKIEKLARTVERLAGAVDVLRTGRMMRVRGTYESGREYKSLDVVMLNGASFIALEDRPGPCPGDGWQLLAGCGSRGARGPAGARGERGLRGLDAPVVPHVKGFNVDAKTYTLSVLLSDGQVHALSLRAMFAHFIAEIRARRS